MTRSQLRLCYGQIRIQNAREDLRQFNILRLSQAKYSDIEQHVQHLEMQAFPPDEEADGELNKDRMKELKRILDNLREKDEGFRATIRS